MIYRLFILKKDQTLTNLLPTAVTIDALRFDIVKRQYGLQLLRSYFLVYLVFCLEKPPQKTTIIVAGI